LPRPAFLRLGALVLGYGYFLKRWPLNSPDLSFCCDAFVSVPYVLSHLF
jgi:hypothetical protein